MIIKNVSSVPSLSKKHQYILGRFGMSKGLLYSQCKRGEQAKGGNSMFSFEQIEEARSLLTKEYSFIGNLTKDYRINVNDLIPYTESMDRIRELRKIINL